MTTTSFRGIWPAMLTPLTPQHDIDHARFAAHARSLIDAGCGGVTPFGTTGEGTSFSVAERIAAVDALVAGGVPGAQIIVSTSAAAVADVVALTRHAVSIGAHGCLMLPPFYLKGLSDDAILDCYRWVIDRVLAQRPASHAPLRIYAYHIPQISAVPLSHHVIATLLREYPQVLAGIKDSQCERAHSVALAAAFMNDVPVYVGNEADLRTLGRLGSRGAISGLANFWPQRVHQLVMQPDAPGTAEAEAAINTLMTTVAGYSLVPALKAVMAFRTGHDGWLTVRPALRPVAGAGVARLKAAFARAGVDVMAS